ncbi:MAG: 1-acyl-sn-glycerol-3-phosphate acyltransferase [Flavobacteriaceae bacterium]|nr:1-acyl-sn-glycerol-3-phosphate acyltransferase [Flavobacteriaceae bacterium]
MKLILPYILSTIYYLFFHFGLLFFHGLQWIAYNLTGYKGHKWVVDMMNGYLTSCLYILGTRITFINRHQLPKNVPLIIVSNHQGLYDISPISWFFRRFHPKFVSKKELGKGIPSVSYNLRHGGSVLIDRKDAKQSITTIINFGKYIEKNNYTAVIFPEGTRSKTGKPKPFSAAGLKVLAKFSPSSYVIPMTINNCWKLARKGKFPLAIGQHITFEIHKPIKATSLKFEDLLEKVENTIKNSIIL